MGDIQTMRDRHKEKLRGRDRRSLNLSTKLTAVEARVIEDAATRAGKTPSEVGGTVEKLLLRAAQGGEFRTRLQAWISLSGVCRQSDVDDGLHSTSPESAVWRC